MRPSLRRLRGLGGKAAPAITSARRRCRPCSSLPTWSGVSWPCLAAPSSRAPSARSVKIMDFRERGRCHVAKHDDLFLPSFLPSSTLALFLSRYFRSRALIALPYKKKRKVFCYFFLSFFPFIFSCPFFLAHFLFFYFPPPPPRIYYLNIIDPPHKDGGVDTCYKKGQEKTSTGVYRVWYIPG